MCGQQRCKLRSLAAPAKAMPTKAASSSLPHAHSSTCPVKCRCSPVHQQSTAGTSPATALTVPKFFYPTDSNKLILNKGKDRGSLIAPSTRGRTAAFACAKVETDAYKIPSLANFLAVTMKVSCQCYEYGQQFAKYVLKFIVQCLLILLLCTLQASCLLYQPEKQNPPFRI